jgi:hypothetical protein
MPGENQDPQLNGRKWSRLRWRGHHRSVKETTSRVVRAPHSRSRSDPRTSAHPDATDSVLPRQIIGQRVQVGLRYAGQIVTIEVDEITLRVYDQCDHLIKQIPRTSRKEVRRQKT